MSTKFPDLPPWFVYPYPLDKRLRLRNVQRYIHDMEFDEWGWAYQQLPLSLLKGIPVLCPYDWPRYDIVLAEARPPYPAFRLSLRHVRPLGDPVGLLFERQRAMPYATRAIALYCHARTYKRIHLNALQGPPEPGRNWLGWRASVVFWAMQGMLAYQHIFMPKSILWRVSSQIMRQTCEPAGWRLMHGYCTQGWAWRDAHRGQPAPRGRPMQISFTGGMPRLLSPGVVLKRRA